MRLKIKIEVRVFSVAAVVRVCLVPMRYGLSWLCFMAEPAIVMGIRVTLGDGFRLTDLEHVQPFIKHAVVEEIAEMTYPHRIDLDFPLSSA